ncbi:ribonuclease M5 [Tannockella kyphosi]|uniref:ribonuclease M5 n=1 Tax=Tannockella kyphosi TaxID=2899121 RepID=UPI002011002F|nr:ribonuclease M5 [Tannockella kyphosi]
MKEIKEVIVVEGKTDTAVLQQLFHVKTIETQGLQLSDKTLELIVSTSKVKDIIVLTDPDYPGKKIRQQIQDAVPTCKHAFVERKDAIGKKKLGIAEARKEAIIEALENVVQFDSSKESITWKEFLSLDIIGNTKRRESVYQTFNLGQGNVKTLFKRLNMVGITKEDIVNQVGE